MPKKKKEEKKLETPEKKSHEVFSALYKADKCHPFYGRLVQLAFSLEPAAVGD